jgi:DNA-binding NarL/FixJ family response regulator
VTEAPTPLGVDSSATRIRVVIVDDVAGLRRLFRIALEESRRFEIVGEAQDGVEAIAAAEQLTPDLMLLDLSMPRMDGLEALPRILLASPSTRVVVLSGLSQERMSVRARELGAAEFIEKGVTPERLVETLVEVVQRNGNPARAH